MNIWLQFLLLILGFVMLIKGADWFVDGVAGIAERFGIPQIVIGLTIVAMGTSARRPLSHQRRPLRQRRHHHRQHRGQQYLQRAGDPGHHLDHHPHRREEKHPAH
jgi:hypothetical protein